MTNDALNDNEVCPNCKNKKHARDCWKCGKYGKLWHKTVACRCLDKKDVTCFNCNEKGHLKRDCPKLKKNGQCENNRGAVYKLGAVDAQQDPKVVTGSTILGHNKANSSNRFVYPSISVPFSLKLYNSYSSLCSTLRGQNSSVIHLLTSVQGVPLAALIPMEAILPFH
nr:hypothetical protein [Tanacetum cinerariifolium]